MRLICKDRVFTQFLMNGDIKSHEVFFVAYSLCLFEKMKYEVLALKPYFSHQNHRKLLRIRNKLVPIAEMLPSVFQMALVYPLLCAHGLDFGQNLAKCFQNAARLASFSEKVDFCHIRTTEKVCFFLGVVFRGKALNICCSERWIIDKRLFIFKRKTKECESAYWLFCVVLCNALTEIVKFLEKIGLQWNNLLILPQYQQNKDYYGRRNHY